MKKFIKWFLFSLLVSGGLALAICYMVIPERTKCAIDILIGYLNTPLGIVGGTTITLGLVAYVIVKTLYEHYKHSIRNDLEEGKSFVEKQRKQAQDYYENALKEKQEISDILGAYSKEIDNLKDNLLLLCDTIPNAKVKALGENIKSDSDRLKTELKEQLESNEFGKALEEKDHIKELEDKFEELRKLVEQYGEREERTND